MNEKQRKYLADKVTATFNSEKEKLEKEIGEEPMISKYVEGAFLDGSAQMLDPKTIKQNILAHIRELGNDDFVKTESYYRHDKGKTFCKIHPFVFMKPPASYEKDRAAWEKKKAEVDRKVKELKGQLDVLLLKINLGSSKLLEKLVEQIDSLGELDLFSNKLTLLVEDMEKSQKLLK